MLEFERLKTELVKLTYSHSFGLITHLEYLKTLKIITNKLNQIKC